VLVYWQFMTAAAAAAAAAAALVLDCRRLPVCQACVRSA
jgi:hypothetical protein